MARVVVAHQECLLGPSDKLRRTGETCYEKSVFAYPIPEKPADIKALTEGKPPIPRPSNLLKNKRRILESANSSLLV